MTEQEDINRIYGRLKALEEKIDDMHTAQMNQEVKTLKSRISLLAGLVGGLALWAWQQIGHLIKLNIGG